MVKTIKIGEETHSRLSKMGTLGNKYEDVIKQLLEYAEGGRIEFDIKRMLIALEPLQKHKKGIIMHNGKKITDVLYEE